MVKNPETVREKIDCEPAMLCVVPSCSVLYLLYSVLNYPLYFPLSQGKICLDIKFVPPGGGDRKIGEQIDGDEIDGDEDENQEDEDEHDHDKGEEKRSTKVKKRIPRTRVARKWSDKIKDFQVM